MPIYEYECATCGHHLEALQKIVRHAAARVPGVRQARRSSGWCRRRVPADRQRLVRDRLQVGQGDEAQPACEKGDKDESSAALKRNGDRRDAKETASPDSQAGHADGQGRVPAADKRGGASRSRRAMVTKPAQQRLHARRQKSAASPPARRQASSAEPSLRTDGGCRTSARGALRPEAQPAGSARAGCATT